MKTRKPLVALAGVGVAALLVACGTSGPTRAGSAGSGGLTVWAISGSYNDVYTNSVSAYNGQNHASAQLQLFDSTSYENKMRVSLGAGNPPDVFENWGGSTLGTFVQKGLVKSLSPALKSRFLPSLLESATIGGKLYGVPMNGISPAVIFYDKKVFAQYRLSPPATFDQLLTLVKTLRSHGVTPLSVGGVEQWPELMYEEYLIDRVGGISVVDDLINGVPGAWSNPAVIKANTLIRELVSDGAFENGFSSVSYNTGQATALLYTGKAAMELQGAWEYAAVKKADPGLVSSGDLGWFPFPSVTGGAGDPSDLEGNPANYYSVAAASKNVSGAVTYVTNDVMSPSYVTDLIKDGRTPPVPGIAAKLAGGPNAAWNSFVYNLAAHAAHYTLSWDQALPSATSSALLTNLSSLFLGQLTPQAFAAAMNKAAG